MTTLNIYTSTEVARLISGDVRQVRHILRSRGIQPVHKAGQYSLYDHAAVLQCQAELVKMHTSTRSATTKTTEGQRNGKGT